ncbi:MAG TPA: type IV secretion system DNA-binding domain-containing protein [Pyrinomonadaceae bacterium]
MQNPQFTIPQFHYYAVTFPRSMCETMFYLVPYTADITRDTFHEAAQSANLIDFLARFPGRWFNRDPYAFFYECNKAKTRAYSPSYILNPQREEIHPIALKELPGYSRDELVGLERLITLYRGLSHDVVPPLIRILGHPYRNRQDWDNTQYVDEEFLSLTVPNPTFPHNCVALAVIPPPVTKLSAMRDLFYNLTPLTHPFSFELVDRGETTSYQIVCSPQDQARISRQIQIVLPECGTVEVSTSYTTPLLHSLTLNLPLYALRELPAGSVDPLTQVFDVLEASRLDETTAMQFVCWPFPSALANQFIERMNRGYYFHSGQDMYHIHRDDSYCNKIKNKLPLWHVTIRLLATNLQTLANIKERYIDKFTLPDNQWVSTAGQETLQRRDMSQGVLLSSAELASLAHFPSTPIPTSRLETASMKAKLPPELFTRGEVHIGLSEARGQRKPVALPDSVRARHLYVVGKSGSGKSTLIANIAAQDIARGEGVCVIDPHGDLVSELLDYIPQQRVKDSIYFNVSDRAHPIGLDLMNANSEGEIEILTDDLVTTFRRLTESWGERMETILRYAFNTLLRTPGATFLDLQKLLTNEGWRSTVVRKLNFPPLTEFWYSQFVNMPKDATQPILSRMTKIVLSPTLNAIFGQSKNTLNFNDVIRNRKILLINLGGDSRDRNNEQLGVSDEMKKLIGSVIVSQLQLAAMRQASIPETERVPCRFFVDEFQNFVSGAFPKILSEARKYKLSLTVAHQYISQLDDATRNAVFGNVGTMIVLPLGQKDAAYLGAELGAYTPEDVANLSTERHEALCRPSTMAADTFLFTTLPPRPVTQSFAKAVIDHTRAEYSTANTEEEILDLPSAGPDDSPLAKKPMRGTGKVFASTAEKILHYVTIAGYLTTSQIIELCYSHLSEASKRPAASRDLKKLTDTKKLKSTNWHEGKIFYAGGSCNPTSHNVAVRDILIKIVQSGFEVAEVISHSRPKRYSFF